MLHVIPVNDLRQHELSRECWCIPSVQTRFTNLLDPPMQEAIVTHNALDCREKSEEVSTASVSVGGWKVLHG